MNLEDAIKWAAEQKRAHDEEEDSKGREAILEVLRKGVDPATWEAIEEELQPAGDHFGIKWQGNYYVIHMREEDFETTHARGVVGTQQIVYIYQPTWFFQPLEWYKADLENGHDLLLYLGQRQPNPKWATQESSR